MLNTSWGWRGVWLMAACCLLFSIFAMDRFYSHVSAYEARLEQQAESKAAAINEGPDRRAAAAVPLLEGYD